MAIFNDESGREWKVNLTIGVLESIRDDLDIDLGKCWQGDVYLEVDNNILLLVRILFYVCDAQRQERQMTEDDFGKMLVGDTIDKAKGALEEALMRFFPSEKREMFQTILEKNRLLWREAMTGLDKLASPEEIKRLVQKALDEARQNIGKASGRASTQQQAS